MQLLQLKHWQLFIITFVAPFILYLAGMIVFGVTMALSARNAELNHIQFQPHISDFILPIILGSLSFLISLTTIAWMYQIATKLQTYMHPDMRRLKIGRFRVFFFFPLIYILFVLTVFVPFIVNTTNAANHQQPPNIGSFILIIVCMFIGHFFTMFCTIFTFYFLAKTLKSAELQREAHFSDYIGEFFLFWFFPVGVWFIQPKVNRIINGEIRIKQSGKSQEEDF